MDAEDAYEGEQYPTDRVVQRSLVEAELGLAFEARHQKKVDQPADAEQSESEQPDRAGDRLAEVEPMRTGEAEDPEDVADHQGVGFFATTHKEASFCSAADGRLRLDFLPKAGIGNAGPSRTATHWVCG